MSPSKTLRLCLLAATAAGLLPGSTALASPDARRAQAAPLLSASAFGTKATVGAVIKSGPTAPVGLGNCGTFEVPVIKRNAATAVNDPPRLRTGAITTSAETFEDAQRVGARGISTVEAINVLGGTVTAREAHAVSESFRTSTGFDASGASSTMTGLKVLGVPIEGTPARMEP